MPGSFAVPQCPDRPFMSDAETECFGRWIPRGGRALEFGMGGSTRFFFERGGWQLTSVESDPGWVQLMRQDPVLAFFLRKERLRLRYADIGPVRPLGTPRAQLSQPIWLRYHQDVWRDVDAAKLDFVLVDGRFRVACACQAILRCGQDAVMLIHDFWNRENYHVVLEFLDVIDRAESSVVAKIKKDIDKEKVLSVYDTFKFVYE